MVVKVDTEVMAGGAMVAQKIEFEDDAMHFEMVVLGELRSVANVNLGNPVTVTLTNPKFDIDADGLDVSSTLANAFASAMDTSDLVAGEVVQIHPIAAATLGPPIAVTVDRVRLRMTQLTATVAGAPAPPSFVVGDLPGLFTSSGGSTISVETSSATDFDGVSGVSALMDQNVLSIRGLLFKNGANPPVLIANKVRKR
jgi:hypothetical protein